jgi:hypothetical protein
LSPKTDQNADFGDRALTDDSNAQTVEYGDQGPELQPIHVLPLTPAGRPILPPPVGPEVVMGYARAMQNDAQVSSILTGIGKWGLPTRAELQVLEQFRDAWIAENGLQDHGLNAYFGANMVFRRIAWGQISSLNDPRAMAFLHEDEPRNVGGPVTDHSVKPRLDEVMWLANYVVQCCDFWPLYADEWRNSGVEGRYYAGHVYFVGFLRRFYLLKYGYLNRSMQGICAGILERLANATVASLGDRQAWFLTQNDRLSILIKVIPERFPS